VHAKSLHINVLTQHNTFRRSAHRQQPDVPWQMHHGLPPLPAGDDTAAAAEQAHLSQFWANDSLVTRHAEACTQVSLGYW
jgi:hypothetical protein